MATQLRSLTNPNYFREGVNLSGSDIVAKRILKAGATVDEIALASAISDNFVGVSTETIFNNRSASYQKDGKVVLTSGGAVAIGDSITTDAAGKGVTATQSPGVTTRIIGRAATATTGADQDFEVELHNFGLLSAAVFPVADRTAMKAITATNRFDGMTVLVKTDNSFWRFNTAATQATDAAAGSEQFVAVPAAGTGRWHRVDKCFVANFAFDFNMADAAALCTVPEGFTARVAHFPLWEVATAFTGGASSAIGVSTNKASYNTKGDLLGGASGDVAAGLTAGVKVGTIGPKIDTLAEWQALVLVEGDVIRFDRITSAFTAGVGAVRMPLIITSNDSPLTP